MLINLKLKARLENFSTLSFVIFGWLMAFVTYTGAYALRKPLAVATFEGLTYWGVDFKILVITAQVIGYAISKFIGMRLVSGLDKKHRSVLILITTGIAGLSLLLFAITPAPYNIIWILINGLQLGMIWGIVFSYLEGRATTEILGAGLSTTQIFSSGFVKTVGKTLILDYGISEAWMPFFTGLIFSIPLVISVYFLNHLPEPSKYDVSLRSERKPMNKSDRKKLFSEFAFGLVMMITVYVFLSIFRDFRDNFSAEIFKDLGAGMDASIFTKTELPTFVIILLIIGLMFRIKNNYLAFQLNHALLFVGFLIMGVSTLLFQNQMISPFLWMTLIGLGLYMGYVPFQIMMLDRFMATFRCVGTVSFLMLLADGSGYVGSLGILLFKNFGLQEISYLKVLISSSYMIAILGGIFSLASFIYFYNKYHEPIRLQKKLDKIVDENLALTIK